MERLVIIIIATLVAAPAYAQAPQPIVLTPQEYQAVMQALIQRNPIMSLLVDKQQKAQAEAMQKAADLQKQIDAAKETPKP